MANTYTLIASSTVGSGGTATITFTSIPQTYTDLVLVHSLRETTNDSTAKVTFNNDTGSNYSLRRLTGNGTTAGSGSATYGFLETLCCFSTNTANTFGNTSLYIPNYTSSNKKSVSIDIVTENNATAAFAYLTAGLWDNTAAITEIDIDAPTSATFVQYSTAYLYGIKNS